MGDPWGIGGFRGEGKPNFKQIVKKKSVKKSQKSAKSEKNLKNLIFFLLKMVWNALGTPRNTFKSQQLAKKT